jgi:hypothetical protein
MEAIDQLKDNLSTMMVIRAELINRQDQLFTEANHFLQERIFTIYSKEAPSTLVQLLYSMKLIEENEAYGQHTVSSVFFNFAATENIILIETAFANYYDKQLQNLIQKIADMTNEMQDCYDALQEAA